MKRLRTPNAKLPSACWLCWALAVSGLSNVLAPKTTAQHRQGVTGSAQTRRSALIGGSFSQRLLSFEVNRGQSDPKVKFFARGSGYDLFLTPTAAVLILTRGRGDAGTRREETVNLKSKIKPPQSAAVQMKLVDANPKPEVEGVDQLPARNNYFIGNDPKQWRTGIPTYAKVKYRNVYPGIDLIYYGDERQLEYDIVVGPGADHRSVLVRFEGADKIEVDGVGNLVLHVADEKVLQRKPNVYQTVNGARKPVEGKYAIRGANQIGFEVGAHDRSKPLVIDPVLVYSTFLTGSSADEGVGITVDSAKNTYITGITNSLNFPTSAGAFQTAQGNNDVFIVKFDASGSLVYSTYIGGSGNDEATSIKVDSAGNAYITGSTDSPNFPTTTGAFETSPHGGSDVFVAKLNPTGSALLYSTYLGGSSDDEAFGLATDVSGNAYVTGVTDSSNFPTTTSAHQSAAGGGGDAFVARLNPTGTTLDYSTYLGGNNADLGSGIATDLAGNAYVTGTTYSPNFPVTAGAFQNSYAGSGDAFVAKLNASGAALSYSTYLGGVGNDNAFAITYGVGGWVYLTGSTASPNFPTTANVVQGVLSGNSDAFIAKLNTSLAGPSSLIYSTYLGGSNVDWGFGLSTDLAGNAYVTGATHSTNFPGSANGSQSSNRGASDAFAAKLNFAGTALLYATYLGGLNNDAAMGNASDSEGNAYLTGITNSPDFPVTAGAFQISSAGNNDAFFTKLAIPQTAALLHLILEESGPASNQGAALDSALFLRDPFSVQNLNNRFGPGGDHNTRVMVFATNLQLAQNETPSSVIVSLMSTNNVRYDIPAEDVRLVPNFPFTQVVFRLPDNLPPSTYIITLSLHGESSNAGSIRISN